MNDSKLIEVAKTAVKVIVRRPHAYKFKQQHEDAPIPGLVVLDAEGKFLGAVALPSDKAVDRVLELLRKPK